MKAKTVFFCTECGSESAQMGRAAARAAAHGTPWWSRRRRRWQRRKDGPPQNACQGASDYRDADGCRRSVSPTGMGELDRVLGGGAVQGSLVLVGGAPGIGKSTLMLQICQQLGQTPKCCMYRARSPPSSSRCVRSGCTSDSENLYVFSETRLGDVLECVSEEAPDILIVDSIQTLYNEELDSPAGSVSQVKDCTMTLMQLARDRALRYL